MDSNVDNAASSTAVSEQNQSNLSSPAVTAAERMFAQSQVDKIVGAAKHEAIEAYKRTQSQPTQQYQSNDTHSNYRNDNRGLTEEDARRIADEALNSNLSKMQQAADNHANTEAANRIVSSYKNKIAAGQEKYEDFANVTNKVNMGKYPNVVRMLAENVDNASEVLYHLAQNRTKLRDLEYTYEHNDEDGIYDMMRLAESIKANNQSANSRQANQPLSQQRSSSAGSDSKALSMKDLKRKYTG